MLIGLIAASCIFLVLHVLSKGKYKCFIKQLDKKQHPLKEFLPAAFFVLDKAKYCYNTKYDRKILTLVAEIYGPKHSQHYLKVHWAGKITAVYFGLLFVMLVGIGAGIDHGYGIFSISLLAAILYFTDKDLEKKVKKRRTAIQIDFPDFLNKLTLLINAGMTVSKAWEKTVLDNRKESPLYEELYAVLTGMYSGKSEQQAYEEFAKRCRISEATRFVSVILQNHRKGNSEMVSVLRVFANECWEARKNTARRLGEEASTRMLLPMMLMFFAILLIVITPAVLVMRGM